MLKELLTNPMKLTILGGVFFILGLIDIWITGATSFSESDMFGKAMIGGMMAVLIYLLFTNMIIPLIKTLGRLFKRKNPNENDDILK